MTTKTTTDVKALTVTTGPIAGSRKIYVASERFPEVKVPLREIALNPSAEEPPVVVYDCSGPYTDETADIDIVKGIEPLRRDWIVGRDDVEPYDGRSMKPEDNGRKELGEEAVASFAKANLQTLRAKNGAS